MIDYHIHTAFSLDSTSPMETYIYRAIEIGMQEIGFSEHWDFDPEDDGYGKFQYEKVRDALFSLRDKFRDRIAIKFGVEITYQREREGELRENLEGKEFDYIIGSIHLPGGIPITEREKAQSFFRRATPEEVYPPYFEELRSAAGSGIFQILGHFDIFKRYGTKYLGPFQPGKFEREIEGVLKEAIRTGTALELNTSGLRHDPGETYPSPEVCRLFKNLGGKRFTFGSDAHQTPELCFEYGAACTIISELGINSWTTFFRKEPGQLKWSLPAP